MQHGVEFLLRLEMLQIPMSVMDFLGKDYLSSLGLPPINIPGCAPVGDNLTETIASILMFLVGLGKSPFPNLMV